MKATGYTQGNAFEIELCSIGASHSLRKDAAAYFLLMRLAAKEAGVDLVVNSSFRSNESQERLRAIYDKGMQEFKAGKRAHAPSIAARPGYSNHQSGVAVDINRAPGDDLSTPASDSPVDNWLNANAKYYKYKRTVPSEAWHWEFDEKL